MSQFSKNLKILRESNGETQTELANTLHFAQNTISNYERGISVPDLEKVSAIAKRYGVTAEDLLSEDLSYFAFDDFDIQKLSDIEFRKKLFSYMYPIFKSEEALKNSEFLRAFEEHRQFRESFISMTPEWDILDSNDLYDGYYNSAECGIIEAKANLVSLYFLISDIALTGMSLEPLGESFNLTGNFARLMAEITKTQSSKRETDELSELYDSIESEILGYIHDLKLSGKYADVADYFTVLLFIYALADKEIDTLKSRDVAYSLIELGTKMKNRYICRYRAICAKLQTTNRK